MTRLKTVGSFVPVLVFLLRLPGSFEQFHTYEWPKLAVSSWDNYNSLFDFESSRVIPPTHTVSGISQNQGFTRHYFHYGPKPGVVLPNSGFQFIPRERPKQYVKEINVTEERMGGYGGFGDTRGYGAYEYKHNVDDNQYPMPIADALRVSTKRTKKPFMDTFFNLLPIEDI